MTWSRAHGIVAVAVLAAAVWTMHPAPVSGTPVRAPLAVCQLEDGSGPNQVLPCLWDGTVQGNGIGRTVIVWPTTI